MDLRHLPLCLLILAPVVLLCIVAFFFSSWLAFKGLKLKKEIKLEEALNETTYDVSLFQKKARANLRLACLFANLPEVQEALARRDRQALYKAVLPLYEVLNEQGPYPLFIHFHIPPGKSFLRVWKPDAYGDDLSKFRHMVVSVLTTTKPAFGLEMGRMGLAIRGIAPVLDPKGHLLGSVEVFCLLEDFVKHLQFEEEEETPGIFVLASVDPNLKSKRPHRRGPFVVLKRPSEHEDFILPMNFLSKALREPVIKIMEVDEDKGEEEHAVVGIPLIDYSGHHIGVYVRLHDLYFLDKDRKQILKQNVLPAFSFLFMAALIVSYMVRFSVIYPLSKMKNEIDKLSRTVGKRLRENVSKYVVDINGSKEIMMLIDSVNNLVYELDELASFRQAIEIDPDPESIYNRLARVFKEKFGLFNFAIYEVSNSKNQMILKIVEPKDIENSLICHSPKFSAGSCRVVRSAQQASSFHFTETCEFFQESDTDYVCLPLITNGKVIAVVHFLLSKEEDIESKKGKIEQIVAYLQEAAPILESKRFARSLKEMSMRDPLTGLYNRRVLADLLPQLEAGVRRRGTSMGVMMLDLDHFKLVNDTYGHAFGDRVLARVAQIVRETLRKSDLPVRYGGEEFLLLLPDSTAEGTERAGERIRERVAQESLFFEGQPLKITVSIGIAIFPEDDEQIDRVIKFADLALYQAKARGRNCVVRFRKEFLEADHCPPV